jgi:anthranilate phosphoribosyltransferase
LRPLLAGALLRLGTKRSFIVSGEDGLGDVTLAGTTNVTEVAGGRLREFTWEPEDFGIARRSLDGLLIDTPAASAVLIRKVLGGESGSARDIVILNAAAGLLAAGRATEPKSAAATAAGAIDSGAAERLLGRLAVRSHQPA